MAPCWLIDKPHSFQGSLGHQSPVSLEHPINMFKTKARLCVPSTCSQLPAPLNLALYLNIFSFQVLEKSKPQPTPSAIQIFFLALWGIQERNQTDSLESHIYVRLCCVFSDLSHGEKIDDHPEVSNLFKNVSGRIEANKHNHHFTFKSISSKW